MGDRIEIRRRFIKKISRDSETDKENEDLLFREEGVK